MAGAGCAATLRRTLESLRKMNRVWLTDTEAVLGAAGLAAWLGRPQGRPGPALEIERAQN